MSGGRPFLAHGLTFVVGALVTGVVTDAVLMVGPPELPRPDPLRGSVVGSSVGLLVGDRVGAEVVVVVVVVTAGLRQQEM
jgi:hypothetical protein